MHSPLDVHIGKRLRYRRRLLGLTQADLAARCGVRFQQIQKYECGLNGVPATRLWRLAQVLDVTVDYFFHGLDAHAAEPQERERLHA